jgi:hypothetical protein
MNANKRSLTDLELAIDPISGNQRSSAVNTQVLLRKYDKMQENECQVFFHQASTIQLGFRRCQAR